MAKQNNRHQAGKRPEITRDIYNTVRKYDRRAFEGWVDSIYDFGYDDGIAQAIVTVKEARSSGYKAGIEAAINALAKVKGIGPKRYNEISASIRAFATDARKAMEEPKE